MIQLRQARREDAQALLALSGAVGWNHTAADCRAALEYPEGIGVLAEAPGGAIGGSAIGAGYGSALAFISLVIVLPEFRRRGLASRMLEFLMEHYRETACLRLHASPAGKHVYEPLGFRVCGELMKYSAADFHADPVPGVEAMNEADLAAVSRIDRENNGLDRSWMIRHFFALDPAGAFVLRRDGAVAGFCFSRPGREFRSIIGVQAPGVAEALALVAASAATNRSQPLLLDVPTVRRDFIAGLVAGGFQPARELIWMDARQDGPPLGDTVFATLGGDIG